MRYEFTRINFIIRLWLRLCGFLIFDVALRLQEKGKMGSMFSRPLLFVSLHMKKYCNFWTTYRLSSVL